VLGDTGRYQESLEIQRAGYEDQSSRYGPNNPRTMHSMHDLAVTVGMNGDYETSEDLSQRVFKFSINFYGPNHPRSWNIEYNLGLVYERQGNYSQGEARFKNILKGRMISAKRNHPGTIDCIRHLGFCLERQQKFEESDFYNHLTLEMLKEEHSPIKEVSDIADPTSLQSDGNNEDDYKDLIEQQHPSLCLVPDVANAVTVGGGSWGSGGDGGRGEGEGWYHGDDKGRLLWILKLRRITYSLLLVYILVTLKMKSYISLNSVSRPEPKVSLP
jgi:tetratricopeptide (TPR) repeat protein